MAQSLFFFAADRLCWCLVLLRAGRLGKELGGGTVGWGPLGISKIYRLKPDRHGDGIDM